MIFILIDAKKRKAAMSLLKVPDDPFKNFNIVLSKNKKH